VKPRLSVALIARNEAHQLRACLASVAWADEIVVVENNSIDGTAALARELGAKVINTPDWPGFGVQKNRAIDACSGDWILVLDCDERVDAALRAQIESTIAAPAFDVYRMPRRSTYCGQFIEHGGWSPDYVRRLFKRGAARFSDARVHENLIVERPIGTLAAPLTHYSFRSLDDVIGKMNRYSSDSAAMLAAECRTPGIASAVLHGLAAFFRTYVLKRGFLDGRMGFLLAVSNAEGSYYRYAKAWLAAQDRAGQKRDDHENQDQV
jgi:glycosyltransferase involved in cell wall biosynthesis